MDRLHVNYVELTRHEAQRCRELATQQREWSLAHNVRNYKADDSASNLAIVEVGIAGEYTVMKALGVGGFYAINTEGTNPEGDVLLPDGQWMEVKTTQRPGLNMFVASQHDTFAAAYGALVWAMPEPRRYAVVGWCTKDEFDRRKWLETNMPKPMWLMSWRHLHSCQHWPLFRDSELTTPNPVEVTS